MKSRAVGIVVALVVAGMLALSLPVSVGAGKPSRLTPAEVAFAEAVGTGTYAYEVNQVYAYEYGEVEMELGQAWRGAGSEPAHAYAEYLANEMTRIGLQGVEKEPFPVHAYHYGGASVQVVDPGPGEVWLGAGHGGLPGTTESPFAGPDGSLTAEIAYVGLGTRFDYEGLDVEGKLVLIDVSEEEMYWLQYPLYEAELHGAIGAVVHWIEYQELEGSVATHDSEARTTIPAVTISHTNAAYLKDLILTADGPVRVKVWADAQIDYNGTGFNVYGYIPGTSQPDEYVIIGDHYDKWWYGASDDGSGVARLLGMAQAMVASGYEPERTIVFLATDAEEYGWTDTEFDWGLGAWWAIFEQHPDWTGRTRGYFNLEGGGDAGATSVYAYGTPETEMFRKSLLPLFDEWFKTRLPWSAYYYPAASWTESFPTTWADIFSFGAAGIPTLEVGSWRSLAYSGYSYHTQMDTIEWVSAESLAMSIIANGFAAMELDRALLAPYSFQKRIADLGKYLNKDLILAAGVDASEVFHSMREFYRVADNVWSLLRSTRHTDRADLVNAKLMETADLLLSELTWVGGYIQPFYPHQHYQDDSWFLREGIRSLEDGNIDRALMWLSWVYGMYHGRWCSYENYEYMQLDRWNVDNFNQFWGRGRSAMVIDIWHEYDSLWTKKATGVMDYADEIASLEGKYAVVVGNFQDALDSMAGTLDHARELLGEVTSLLRDG